ncbi:MAG: amidohydrolase family protein [Archaeoglobaceae archaeon]
MLRGALICDDGLRHGYLVVEECRFEESRLEFDDYYFSPTFFNAHTHLADSAFKEAPHMPLEELVGPEGYKHRMLAATRAEILRSCVADEVRAARDCGTTFFLDFREGDVSVVEGIAGVLPLARPKSVDEAENVRAFGFAYSSARDHDLELLQEVREVARRRNMLFAIHAGERDCEDVEAALELQPDLLVHMNMCEEKIGEVLDAGIPVVSCVRSNAFFGLLNLRAYRTLAESDLWLLGSDNAMIASASLLDEMHFAAYIVRDDAAVFRAAVRGFELFGMRSGFVVFNRRNSFKNTKNPLATLVRRASAADVELAIHPDETF